MVSNVITNTKIFKTIYQKIKSLNILKYSLLQANKLVILLQKYGGKDGHALFFATKYRYRTTYHLNSEAIFFGIGTKH